MTGIAIVFCALATNKYELILCAAFAGLLLGAGNPLQQTIVQELTPETIAGKVFASFTAMHFVGEPVGLLLAGFMTQLTNVEFVLQSAGSLLIALAIFGL